MMNDSEELARIVSIILWWAEGTKKRRDKRHKNLWIYTIEITNTNPQLIKIVLEFLRRDIGIDEEKLKAQLQIHEGDDQVTLEAYWSDQLQIPLAAFNKTIVRPKGNKIGKSKGTCKIRYNSKEIYQKLEKELEEIIKVCNNAAANDKRGVA